MEISPHPLEERRDDGAGDAGGAGVSGDKNAESNIDKPRQRILKVNFWWMLGLCCIYTASNIFDIFIWLDTSGFGADEPVWTEVQFIMEYETLPVDGEDLPLLPVFANAMKDELEQTTGVAEHNYELEIASVRKADVRNINGVIDVIQIGIASVRIRFFKPYQWGVQPASVMLQRLDEAAAKPGSVMFEPYINEGGTPAKFKTYNLNTASPLKQDTRTQGPRDGRPPTRVWLDVSGFVQLAGLITGCITAVLAAKMGWDMQMYDIGDIRLSTAGDAASGKYRMKWPLYVTITAAVLRLEVAAELFEARRSKKEQFGLIAVLIAGCVVQVLPQTMLQLYLVQGCGAAISTGIFISLSLKVAAVSGTLVAWERNHAYTHNEIALRLGWIHKNLCHLRLTWQMYAGFRAVEILARLLPIAVLMTLYGFVAVAWTVALDVVLLFCALLWTGVRQGCKLADERMQCCSFCLFFTSGFPLLYFVYSDSFMGRSFSNSLMHPTLYLGVRTLSISAAFYLWYYGWNVLNEMKASLDESQIKSGNLSWGEGSSGGWPVEHMRADPLDGFPTFVAAGVFHIIYCVAFVKVWKRAGDYFRLEPGLRRGLCFCWTCILDCLRRCGCCGGVASIAKKPTKSIFAGKNMSAREAELRPQHSRMLQRLRTNDPYKVVIGNEKTPTASEGKYADNIDHASPEGAIEEERDGDSSDSDSKQHQATDTNIETV